MRIHYPILRDTTKLVLFYFYCSLSEGVTEKSFNWVLELTRYYYLASPQRVARIAQKQSKQNIFFCGERWWRTYKLQRETILEIPYASLYVRCYHSQSSAQKRAAMYLHSPIFVQICARSTPSLRPLHTLFILTLSDNVHLPIREARCHPT